jgi:hypothetical protein
MPDAELTLTKFRTVAKELVELLEADYRSIHRTKSLLKTSFIG